MIACFDIGGTTIKAAVGPAPDALRRLPDIPTPTTDFTAFAAALTGAIRRSGARPDRISIAIPGVIDPQTGHARVANIPCLSGLGVEHALSDALSRPVTMANDADCFTLAEATLGAGKGHHTVFGAILGTGIGGGLVARGNLVNAGGHAGEWGHGLSRRGSCPTCRSHCPLSAAVVACPAALTRLARRAG